jgi:hypothetical protein
VSAAADWRSDPELSQRCSLAGRDLAAANCSPLTPKRERWRGGACCCVARSAIPANIARRNGRRRYVRDTQVLEMRFPGIWKLVEIQSYSIIGALLMAFSCVS